MNCPFKIERHGDGKPCEPAAYLFLLIDMRDGHCIAQRFSNSPIAPKELRDMQARLNTKAVLG